MQSTPKIIAVSEKIYRKLACLYPKAHRSQYAEPMAQLFRDQCRDAYWTGRSVGLMKLWLRTLPDLGKSSVLEQIIALERKKIMSYLNAKNSPTILLIIGLVLGFLSFAFTQSTDLLRLFASASAIAILSKAGVELFRSSGEWRMMLVRTLILMFLYALFMPAWAKADHSAPEGFKLFIGACLFANPIVALMKLVQFLVRRQKS